MARRGEKIGDAYVRIHADGSGIDRETRDSFADLDPVMKEFGRRSNQAWRDGFKEENKTHRKGFQKDILEGLQFQRGVLDAQTRVFSKSFQKSLRKQFRALAGDKDVGNAMGRILMEQVQSGMIDHVDLERLFSQMQQKFDENDEPVGDPFFDAAGAKKIAALRAQALRAVQAAAEESNKAIERDQEEHNKSLADLMRDFEKARIKIAKDGNQADLDEWQKFHDRAQAMWASYYAALSSDDKDFRRRTLDRLQNSAEQYRESLARLSGTTEAYAEHTRRLAQAEKDAEKAQKDSIKTREDALSQMRELDEMIKRIRKGTGKWGEDIDHVRRRMKEMNDRLSDFGAESKDAEKHLRRMRLGLITMTPRVDKARKGFAGLADTVGRLTGKGSRNNFLNFVGSVNRNVLRLTSTLTLGLAKATISILKFGKALVTGGISFKDLRDIGKQALALIGSGLTSLITFGVIIAAIGASVAFLSTALSGLVAIITALAGSVSFALAGLLPLAGLLGPLAAGAIVAFTAFKSLSDAQKDMLKTDLDPLIDQFRSLGDIAANVLTKDVGEWARKLAPQFEVLEEGVHRIASAIKDTIGAAVDEASKEGSGFEQFLARLTTKTENHRAFLATSTRKLGDIFTNVISGLGGFFIAMIPSMNRLLRFLRDITQSFSDWTNSRAGRDQLRDFFEKVGDSAKALGGFIVNVTKLLAKLFDAGREEGDTMFQEMAKGAQDLVDWLSKPQGQKALKSWLEFGREFGEALGNMVVAAGKFIAALDTPKMRSFVIGLVDGLSVALGFLSKFPEIMFLFAGPLGVTIGLLLNFKDIISAVWDFITAPLGDSWITDIAKFLVPGALGLTVLETLVGWITDLWNALHLGDLSDSWISDIGNALTGGAFSGIPKVLGAIGDVRDAIFGGGDDGGGGTPLVVTAIQQLLELRPEISGFKGELDDLKGTLDEVSGAVTDATRDMVSLGLAESDADDTAAEMGITLRTLTSAYLGNAKATAKVEAAIKDQFARTGELTDAQRALWTNLGHTTRELNKGRNEILKTGQAAQDFKGKLKGIPEIVKFHIRETGIKATTNGIAKVVEAAKDLAPNLSRRDIKTIISAAGEEPTKKKIRDVMKRVRELDKAEARVHIDADAERFRDVVSDIDRDVKDADKKKGTPKFDGDTKAFDTRARHVQQQLTILDAKSVSPKVNLDDDQALRDITGVTTALNNIQDEHVTIYLDRVYTGGDPGGGNNGGGNGNGNGNGTEGKQVAGNGKLITIPQITINESADGKATAQELLNHIVAAGY